jgi:hypothetical protein
MFSSLSDAQLRKPPSTAVRRLIERLPPEQSVYDKIAAELIDQGVQSERQRERYERLVAILRLLLHEDGRSEPALCRLVDGAITHHDTELLGINPLAALANYYHSGGKPAASRRLSLERLNRYARIDPLFNNAMACKRNLLRAPHE